MATVDVLMVVDVEGALASNNLTNNIYLVDTNKYMGSGAEGQAELQTKLDIGDGVVWSVAPVDPGTNATIVGFGGTAVSDQVIAPEEQSDGSFQATFQPAGGTPAGTSYQYNATLSFEGKQMTFDPFLIVAD